MRVSEIRVKQIPVNQGLGVVKRKPIKSSGTYKLFHYFNASLAKFKIGKQD